MTARPAWASTPHPTGVRLAGPDDRGLVAAFLAAMDREGLYARHFSTGMGPNLALLDRLDRVDGHDRVVIVATNADGQLLGHAEYVAENGKAEFALMVLPQFRGCGIGGQMLGQLMEIASAAGHGEMYGIVQATNVSMLKLALGDGFHVQGRADWGTLVVSRDLHSAVAIGCIRNEPAPARRIRQEA